MSHLFCTSSRVTFHLRACHTGETGISIHLSARLSPQKLKKNCLLGIDVTWYECVLRWAVWLYSGDILTLTKSGTMITYVRQSLPDKASHWRSHYLLAGAAWHLIFSIVLSPFSSTLPGWKRLGRGVRWHLVDRTDLGCSSAPQKQAASISVVIWVKKVDNWALWHYEKYVNEYDRKRVKVTSRRRCSVAVQHRRSVERLL